MIKLKNTIVALDSGNRSYRISAVISLAAIMLLHSGLAQAIPSPDLVINLSASVAQLLGLLSVVFGGFAMSAKKKVAARRKGPSMGGKVLLALAGITLLGSLAANALQYTGSVDARNQRLHTNLVRKSVENGEVVGDTSIQTLSFSEQLDHPQGISTDTLADWLERDLPLNIIDVRENEEYETGSIEGAAHLRYPDVLARSSLLPDNAPTLLLCYSGNRSSELCGELTKQGKECNFMVGGYEKWLTENRALSSDIDLSMDDLRQLPDFQNKDVLLDTPEVHSMVAEEGAQFLDVRYPNDFVKDHLPNATNITMRALPSAALTERISSLADVPYIAACYDKRSCFYSQLIGLRLARAGLDFRGRYSVPHEYYIEKQSSRAHVANWKQGQEQLTLASYVVTPMRAILDKMVAATGHYALGLLGVVLMIRLMLLPLALKAERDTRVQKSLSGRIADLKDELSDHPRALSEATMQLYKRFKIRPVINMLASLFQLTLMLLFYSAVTQSSQSWNQSFLWLETASIPDPLLILPVLTSILFIGVLASQSPARTRRKALLFGLGGAALLWLLSSLAAAANLYLAVSMGFLILQSLLFKLLGNTLKWDTAGADKTGTVTDTGLIPLSQAHYLPESTGKKASRLGQLIEAGYNVPDGFVFTSEITNKGRRNPNDALLSTSQKHVLNKLWKGLGTAKVAVRSSGANEDGADSSFAGVYESILNVPREDLEGAVKEVYQSLCSERSAAYTQDSIEEGMPAILDQGGVVVQKMVPAEYAGVMFTEHPATAGAMMVEMITGLGEDLVNGNVTPDSFAYGKLTGQLLPEQSGSEMLPPIDIAPLLALGRELEALFEHPQDIEWAYANGKFYLLQARDITRSICNGSSLKNLAERERSKLLKNLLGQRKRLRRSEQLIADEPIYVQSELSELLPRPTPFSSDFMERLWSAGGSTDLACQELGIPYSVHFRSMPYINTIFGWTYVNKQEEKRRLGKGPGGIASFRLARNAEETEAQFRDEFLPRFQSEMVERNAIAMERLTLPAATNLLQVWVNRFVEETYCTAERINISADFHMKNALAKLSAAKLEPAKFLNDDEETVVSHAMSLLNHKTISSENIEEFLLVFGHRAPLDYELSEPRFNEDMNLVRQYIERSAHSSDSDEVILKQENDDASLPDSKVLAISVQRARAFMRLKEEAKHFCLIELAQIRNLLLAIDEKCHLKGQIFQLTIDEVIQLNNSEQHSDLTKLADKRFEESCSWKPLQLPASLSINDLERIDMLTGTRPDAVELTELSGKRVAGESEVVGTVRVITDIDQINTFKQGEILIARMTDPTWYPLFSQARGIVTEVGGWLSHAAIVAREYDLPAIVGVTGICQRLNTGDVIRMTLSGSVEILEEQRKSVAGSSAAVLSQDAEAGTNKVSKIEQALQSEEEAARVDIYQLTSHRLFKYQQRIERRAMKDSLGDRRAQPRLTASGEAEPDRRAANRAANSQLFRKAG
ncbi:PEP/pyruvate-binding domain-containing protein [Granulosicoccus antarcticus]|uniref:Prodigiosin synthesizing transferase PigC n=1 Tax=Granulosicoccus antarcticus IMCC3135 TaxID=1192854 RepID=A0A2Z2NFY9_9GAMM|nr:PEP/pyruvate-binding domain-containing protein [Granulosicoccus antarcticus]ASJ70169.1 Prodigiosin synthesizing transferase PigC [Granulosicoccus antarcticus IMCC3135]